MKQTEIKIGMTYRIREWDDLAAEFGTKDNRGVELLCTPVPFNQRQISYISGKPFTVRGRRFVNFYNPVTVGSHLEIAYSSFEGIEEVPYERYEELGQVIYVIPEILEPLELPPLEPDAPESLLDFLLN